MKPVNINELLKVIGENFHSIRNIQKKTLETVASEIGVKHPVLSRIENGRYEGLSMALLVRLCNIYQVSLEQILGMKNMQVFHLSQNAAPGNATNNMKQVVNDTENGYSLALEQARDEIKYLRGLLESRMGK